MLMCLQGEAQRASSGEAEAGGEDHGPVQGPRSQRAAHSHQGQVLNIYFMYITVHTAHNGQIITPFSAMH